MKYRAERDIRPCPCREAFCGCPHPRGGSTVAAQERALSDLTNAFAYAMQTKLYEKARRLRAGWDDEGFTVDDIKAALLEHVERGDPVDVANFAAFWWNRLGGDK